VVSIEELERFTRQLGILLSTGVDMLRSLDVAAQQAGNPRLVQVARGIAATMADGREFHQALEQYPDIFSPFYYQMARRGEMDSILGSALLAVADYLARQVSGSATPAPATPAGGFADGILPGSSVPLRGTAAVLGAVALSALGSALLWGAGVASLLPADWLGPLVAGWTGLCLAGGTALLWAATWRTPKATTAPAAPSGCSLCGRPEAAAGPLARGAGIALCEACVRSSIDQLKNGRAPASEAASAPAQSSAEAGASQNGADPDAAPGPQRSAPGPVEP
jgi:hypothetical protein